MSSTKPPITPDVTDLRDRIYTPSLRPLLPRISPSDRVLELLRSPSALPCLPRDQGPEGSCGSQALAALIDLQRTFGPSGGTDFNPVSARMLSAMGERHSERPNRSVSLRDVIKGFYHNGVCGDALWPYEAQKVDNVLDVRRSKAARDVSLGAYFRLRPALNDYHSAINEVGAIVASASIHPGWDIKAVRNAGGRIVPLGNADEAHAFVIVGYDDTGFLVLNSWGPKWGGFDGCSGVGHWSYADWADNIMDGWVIRLGVATPTVFPLSIGEQGIYFAGSNLPTRSTPAYEITGHFVHLDDGGLVDRAPYPSSAQSLSETIRYLQRTSDRSEEPVAPKWSPAEGTKPAEGYRGIVLKFAGSLHSLSELADLVASEKKPAKSIGLYPITVAWCSDAVEETDRVLAQIFSDADKQVRKRGDDLNDLIEVRAHGIGRAFWRDVERAAAKSAEVGGPVHSLLTQVLQLTHYSLHLVCEGAGILLLKELLSSMEATDKIALETLVSRLESLDLITPTLDVGVFRKSFAHILKGNSHIRLHLPSPASQDRLCVGAYTRPILALVENSFSSRNEPRPNLLGKSKAAIIEREARAFSGIKDRIVISEIDVEGSSAKEKEEQKKKGRPTPDRTPIRQQDLLIQSKLMQSIFQSIESTLTSGGDDHGRQNHIRRTKR